MPSPTDFNLTPYFDDFNEDKKFHRILFRPAFAVQARELTQSQSILQNQIEKMGDHFFEKGAMVIPGEISYDLNYYAVKLTSFTGTSNLQDFVGVELTGTAGVKATVIQAVANTADDPNTLYIKYIQAGTDNIVQEFAASETISGTATINGVANTSISAVVDTAHTGSVAEIQAGVYYINGFYVKVSNEKLLLDKYTNTPSYRIGLSVVESFIQSTDDNSLLDNAQGSSNENAPGADRFKIEVTLAKKTLSATDDANFIELLRLKDGIVQNQVRSTDYAILEDTMARRTFDESGDYVVRDFDIDLREHIVDQNNRGIFTAAEGGLETLMAAGLAPGKAYVRGYEIETIGTKFVSVKKARDFATQNNFSTRFDVGNFVHVNNVYGSPDIGAVSGETDAFKDLGLYDVDISTRGTAPTGSGSKVNQIGRAKTRGFEYLTGAASSFVFSSASRTSAIYKHFLFDIEMFTHLNSVNATSFTTGEIITGGTSSATGVVQSISTTESVSITSISVASPGVATVSSHNFKEGQQITIDGGTFANNSTAVDSSANTFTVRNPSSTTFELYESDGTTATNITSFTSGGTAKHGVVVVSNVSGTFVAGETITGGSSGNTATLQTNAVGFKAVDAKSFHNTKSLQMAGSPAYSSQVDMSNTYGSQATLTGNITISGGTANVVGSGTSFQTELAIGDEIVFTDVDGTSITRVVEAIISDTNLTISSAISSTGVSAAVAIRQRGKLQNSDKNTAIFKLPYAKIKTLKTTDNNGATDTNFKVRQQYVATLSSGTATINAGTNETFVSLDEGDYIVSVNTVGSSAVAEVGAVLSLTGNNNNGTPGAIFTLGGTPNGKTLTFDFGTAYANAEVKIVATLNRSLAGSKTKTLNADETKTETDQTTIENGVINLGKADIFTLKSVKMATAFGAYNTSGEIDITSRFELDNGQRDNYYDVGRIKLKTGQITPTGSLKVTFDYLSHGDGDYFDVDSYISGGDIDYEAIPEYTSDTTGTKFELRDCLDFRPRVADGSTIDSGSNDRTFTGTGAVPVNVVKFGDDVTSDFEYYLGRIDKIFLDKEGNFKVSEGASALIPQTPQNIDNALHLYTLEIPAYTLSPEDVTIKPIDNKRYTMRDIGKLEDRIQNLEYYTQLNLLEQAAQSLQIQDASGFDRFKNGFIVDNFTGHNIGDVGNSNYKASIDMSSGELRPLFFESNVKLIEADQDGTSILSTDRADAHYAKTGDLITLPYTETTLIDQPFASKSINVNPFDVITWSGNVVLTPESDEWKETERAPELVINNVGGFDTLVSNLGNGALSGFEIGTIWNEWQDNWSGRPVDIETRDTSGNRRAGRRVFRTTEITSAQRVNQTRTGIRQRIVPQTVRNSIGDRIINVAFVPFIRERSISFTATRMKPNTRVYPFFDNVDVSQYVTPTGDAQGGVIVTDSNGSVTGTFDIPDPKVETNDRWRTGQRVFRLTSSATNNRNSVETSAEADYIARGILETVQNTIISTREPRLERQSTSEDRNITRTATRDATRTVGWVDPLAQTFLVDDLGGVFLTSLDLFFKTKDANIPVTLQIREVVNGYPSNKILPFSEVTLNPSSVNTTTDATVATTFTFDSPVYIQENVEYCFVVLANTNKYEVYASRMGETQLGSNRTISQQPYAGVLFKSQNGSTWTADQNEDIKFKIKRAEFNTSKKGVLTLVNGTVESKTLVANPFRTTNGSNVVRVFHKNHGMHGTNNNVTISGVASGNYNDIPHTELNGTFTSISNVTLDSYDITVTTNANKTGDTGGSNIVATQNRLFDVAQVNLQILEVSGTSVGSFIRTTSGRSIHGSETEFSTQSTSEKDAIVTNDNIYFTSPRMIASDINQTNEMSGGKSVFVDVELTSDNTKVSPVIDLQRASMFLIQNRLNTPSASNTVDFVADEKSVGASSAASYITRPLTLENASTALDIRISANVRSSSNVRLFYRITSSDEVRNINDLDFIPFNTDGREDVTVAPSEDDDTFKEYKFSATNLTEFTAFQIKVVMKGSNSSYPPRIKDLRGIALAV